MLWILPLLATSAFATQPDQMGFGARSMGAGGGGVAMVEDGAAAWLNPAGLSRIRRPTASVGGVYGRESFRPMPDVWWDVNRDGVIDERDPPLRITGDVSDVAGVQLQAGKQIGGKFGIGMAAWFPAGRLYRLSTIEPALPTYVFYENRSQRYVLSAGVGGEIVKGVNIGASVDVHPQARLTLLGTLDASVTSPDDPDEGIDELVTEIVLDIHDVELDLGYAARPILGVQLELGRWSEKLDGLVIGASYRPAIPIRVQADLDIQANVSAEDIGDLDPFVLAALVQGRGVLYDHYVPTRIGIGAAWRTDEVFSAYVDAIYEDWRDGRMSVTEVTEAEITAPLFTIDDKVIDGNDYRVELRGTWNFRTGLELKMPKQELDNKLRYWRVTVRGGFAYLPTALRAQGPMSAFLDSDRVQYTMGAGLEVWDPFELVDGPVKLDLFGQLHQLGRTTLPHQADEPTAGFPREGTGIPIGGTIFVIGGQWGFDY